MRHRIAAPASAAAAVAALLAIAAPAPAEAIPAFARRYRFSCTTCHTTFPQLRPFGAEFAARGFALEPGQEPASATIDVGDDLLALPRNFPLAMRFDGFVQARDESPNVDFQAPWVLKLLTGGAIAPGVAFYGYFIVEEGKVVGFEDAYVQFSRIFGAPVDVLAGQFQLSDAVAKRELRLTRTDYEILSTTVGQSPVNLTYDRGVAVAAALGPVDAIATLTNGTGLAEASAAGTFDSDGFKNVGLDLATGLGPARVGVYGFYGRGRQGGVVNTTWYLGPHLDLALQETVGVRAAYLERRDSNAAFLAGEAETVTRGGYVEATWWPAGWNGRWYAVALYNRVDSDDALARRDDVAVGGGWLLRRNVRLVAEVDYDFLGEHVAGSVGTVVAF
jgi:hypothetical protein